MTMDFSVIYAGSRMKMEKNPIGLLIYLVLQIDSTSQRIQIYTEY